MPFGYRERKGWPLTVSGGVDVTPPKAAVVKLCLPQVTTGFDSDCLHRQDFSVRSLHELPVGKL